MRNRTILRLIKLVESAFTFNTPVNGTFQHVVCTDWFADLLFENELPTHIVKMARMQTRQRGALKAFLLSLWEDSVGWENVFETVEERNEAMLRISEAVLAHTQTSPTSHNIHVSQQTFSELLASFELDGYRYLAGKLVRQDENAFDVQEVSTMLENLYRQVGLGDAQLFSKSLRTVDDHYESQKWGDCIKHARDLIETSQVETLKVYAKARGEQVKPTTYANATSTRDKLHGLGFFDEQEKTFYGALYSLLSQQGGHANLSQKENALSCRQHALSAVHFVLLRCEQLLSATP